MVGGYTEVGLQGGGQMSIASKVSRLVSSRGMGGRWGRAVADRQAAKNSHSIAECWP